MPHDAAKCRVAIAARGVISGLMVGLLTACGSPEPPREASVPVAARAVNYSDQGATFSINRAAGGVVSKHGESGINCCLGIPEKWRPGIRVKVYVQNDALWLKYKDPNRWQETELEIPPYAEPGDLYVAILPDEKVEIFSSVSGPGGMRWPFRLGDPWAECLKDKGRARCEEE